MDLPSSECDVVSRTDETSLLPHFQFPNNIPLLYEIPKSQNIAPNTFVDRLMWKYS